ncbi:hypothetical protein Tco_1005873 [Tanacetum coccineum]|uniref:Reverse transcriptase domain-containing protein n=1 Tax=Tanacetum coccineum TaxID=301880 RepID=A0ABQ5FHB8_9ASTR
MVFYQIETEEVSDRFVAPCFVNGLEAYDGEINLGVEENMISNEYAVKLCLEHEVKRGNKVVKKELIVALRGEIYFVKFIINPEEDEVKPGVIFGRSFLRITKAITDFGVGTITIYPDIDPLLEETKEEGKSNDDWDHLLDFNIDDIPLLGNEGLSSFVCKMGKSSRNKKRAMENLNFFYQDIGTSSSAGGHLTQEEATKEAIAIRMSQKFALLEEERPIIETMAYHDKYKKILDEVWKDKVELDGKIVKEDKEAVKRIKGEALKEKDDPEAFIFPIRLEGQLEREAMKKVDRGITMINHTQAKAMGILINVLCQVGVTTLIAKFLILDISIDRDSPIVVGRGFLRMIGGIINTLERLYSTFDGFCHQTFRAARSYFMRNTESDSDDEEDYQIKRNKFGAPIYGPKPAPYLNCIYPDERPLAIQSVTNLFQKISVWKKATMETHDDEAGSSRSKRSRQHETVEEVLLPQIHHEFLLWEGCHRDAKSRYNTRLAQLLPRDIYSPCIVNWNVLNRMSYDGEIDDMLGIRLGLYQAVELEEEGFNVYFKGGLRSDEHFNAQDYWVLTKDMVMSLSAPIYCRDLDITTLRDLIDYDGKLILEDPQQGVPRVGIPRPPRASMQDLYGYIKNRKKAIKNEKSRTRERKSVQEPEAKCMRTRSQARNRNRRQQQITTVIVEEPEITMADNRTMAQMLQAPIEGYEDAILDTFYNALNANDQDSLNSAAGGNFLDKMPRECLRIIENVAALITEMSELKNLMKTMLIDKQKAQAPATVKVVEQSCVTCGGVHSYKNCPATDGNVYRDNIQEYVSQAAAANFNQGNTNSRPPMVSNQIRPPGFPPIQNNQNCFNLNQGNNFNQNRGTNFNQNRGSNFNQGQVYQPPMIQTPVYQAPTQQTSRPRNSTKSNRSMSMLSPHEVGKLVKDL